MKFSFYLFLALLEVHLLVYIITSPVKGASIPLQLSTSFSASDHNIRSTRMAVADGISLNPIILEKHWLSYEMGVDEVKLISPWVQNISESRVNTPESVSKFSFQFDEDTLTHSLEQKVEVKGNFVAVAGDESLDILQSTSSETSIAQMKALVKHGSHTVHLWDTIVKYQNNPTAILSSRAKALIDNGEWETFIETYGTHFIVSKEYGCLAELTGVYKFSSKETKDTFKNKAQASAKYGSFSVAVSNSIEKDAKEVDSSITTTIEVKGDNVSQLSVKEPNKLSSWAEAFFNSYGKLCTSPVLKSVTLVNWADYLHGVQGTFEVTDVAWNLLAHAITAQSVAVTGFKKMFQHLTNLEQAYTKDGSILLKPSWIMTKGINVGKTCDGKESLSGPPTNLTDFRKRIIEPLKKRSWMQGINKTEVIDTEIIAKAFMEEMESALKNYTLLNRHYTPSFEMKAKVSIDVPDSVLKYNVPPLPDSKKHQTVSVSTKVDIFTVPENLLLYVIDLVPAQTSDTSLKYVYNYLGTRLHNALSRASETSFKSMETPWSGAESQNPAFEFGKEKQFFTWICPGKAAGFRLGSSSALSECPKQSTLTDTTSNVVCSSTMDISSSEIPFTINYSRDATYNFQIALGQDADSGCSWMDPVFKCAATPCFSAISIQLQLLPIANPMDRFNSETSYFPMGCNASTRI